MRITFVHHCLCGPQMNILCGVKWQSEMNVCPCCMSLSVCDTKLLSPSSEHSGAVRKRGLLSPHLTLRRYRYSDNNRSVGSRVTQKTSASSWGCGRREVACRSCSRKGRM